MDIKYRHKETGYILSLDEIKNKKSMTFNFAKYYRSNTSEYIKLTYRATDIPLSDDFEIICVESQFESDEIAVLIGALEWMPYKPSPVIIEKLKIMYRESLIKDQAK